MTSKEALQELFIRVGGYRDNEEYTTSRVREIIMKDLEVLDLLKRNIKYNTLLATNCDKQGKVSGKYRELTIIINEKDLDKVEEWLENE